MGWKCLAPPANFSRARLPLSGASQHVKGQPPLDLLTDGSTPLTSPELSMRMPERENGQQASNELGRDQSEPQCLAIKDALERTTLSALLS